MKELEVKILEVDRIKIEKTLVGLGAKKVFDGDMQTLLFDFPDGRIFNGRDVLRLRKTQDKTELTYKKVRVIKDAKSAEEYSVDVSSLEVARKILEYLGLLVVDRVQKHRVSYELDQARFDIDRYNGAYIHIPEFLEIEAESVDSIHMYAGLLGFKPEDCLPWSTDELVRHYSFKKAKCR
jgi:adenylate cyclase, class 2